MEGDRVGYVYRDRFVSEPITSYRYLIQCIKYIHFNPVKAKIVERCEEYKISSYKLFKNKLDKREFNSILNKDAYEELINNPKEFYKQFSFLDKKDIISLEGFLYPERTRL